MSRRRKKTQRMGFVDYCRVDTNGKVTCNGHPGIEKKIGVVRQSKIKSDKDGYFPETDTHTGISEWNAAGAPLFTSTSKVHAPTFGMTAGATCPRIQYPVIMKWLAPALADPKNRDLRDPAKAGKIVAEAVPQKCLACYATQNTYRQAETKRAMTNRQLWWNSTSDKEIEDTLVNAIKHAGNEECTGRGASVKCTFTPGVQTKLFRAFDSGDFQAPRDVRIWRKVAERLPGTKFWFPTTTGGGVCGAPSSFSSSMQGELRKLHQKSNVTVRPSAEGVDVPAVSIRGLGAGTAVVEPLSESKIIRKGVGKWTKICDAKTKKCTDHYVCPGNCASCRMCWSRNVPVVYQRHGAEAVVENIVSLVRRTTGTEPYNPDRIPVPGELTKKGKPKRYKPVAHIFEKSNRTQKELFNALLAKTWQGPTDGWEGIVKKSFHMLPGREREALAKEQHAREVEERKAAREAAKK